MAKRWNFTSGPEGVGEGGVLEVLQRKGISRREFLKFCAIIGAVLAVPVEGVGKIAEALASVKRPPVIWLEFQDCAGCSESFLRASRPTAAEIVLDVLSVDYHETIMAAAGKQAEEAKEATIEEGGHIVIVEGSIPTKEDGIYCCIGGRTAVEILKEATRGAAAVIAVGSCAAYGGLASAEPNPTGAVGVRDLVNNVPVINLPGCPVNVVNITATVVHYLTYKSLPELDAWGRPLFAYGKRIHDNCERRAHFDAGQFVENWGDEGHRKGWCLYLMGCKGPETYSNCPTVRWNEGTNWPVGAGHGCVGCTQPGFWDAMTPFYRRLPTVPGFSVESTADDVGLGLTAVAAVGVAAHAAASLLRRKAEKSEESNE